MTNHPLFWPTGKELDRVNANRVIHRATIPFPEELLDRVGISKIRIFKRRKFALRLSVAHVYLALRSMTESFGLRDETVRNATLDWLTAQGRRNLLEEVEGLFPIYLYPGSSPNAHVAQWVLQSGISPFVLHLADALDGIYDSYRLEDESRLQRERQQITLEDLLEIDSRQTVPMDLREAGVIVSNAAALTRKASAYVSFAVGKGTPPVEWRSEFSGKVRCHVWQAGAEDYDEWITIESEHYCNLDLFWIGPIMNNMESRDRLNAFLRVDKLCTLLTEFACSTAGTLEHRGATYATLTYRIDAAVQWKELGAWMAGTGLVMGEVDVGIQIHLEAGLPVRCTIHCDEMDFCQVFTGFGEAVEVEVPKDARNMSLEESGATAA